jgi:hypothetical protein
MTLIQDINEKTPLYLNFVEELIPGKVWSFYLTDHRFRHFHGKTKEFIGNVLGKDAAVRNFSSRDVAFEKVIDGLGGRKLKYIMYPRGLDYVSFGYFFDITNELREQSQIQNIMGVAVDYIRNRTTLSEAIGVVERNVRFE